MRRINHGFNFTQAVRVAFGVVLALGFGLSARTAAAQGIGLSYTAYRAADVHAAPVRQGDFIRAGEKLLIKIRYLNTDTVAAPPGAIVFTLPEGCAFSTAEHPERIAVSMDGGRQFGALSSLRAAAGHGERDGKFDEVTHVRMTLAHALAPGESGEISIVAIRE